LTYAPPRPAAAYAPERTASRNVAKWAVALALCITLSGFLATLQLFQITSDGASHRTLRRAIAVVSEIDVLLDRDYADLRQRAESVGANETLELQDYPLSVRLTPEEVLGQSRDDLRETLLDRGADAMYEDGTDAMRSEASTGDVGVFSFGGSIDRALDLLREDVHIALGVVMVVLGVISLVLAAALALVTRGFGRLAALAAVALASSTLLLLLALVVRLGLETAGGSEYVRAEFRDIARELAWLPIRNGIILVGLTAFVTAIAAIAARVTDARSAGP
jgi:hypothetical protein